MSSKAAIFLSAEWRYLVMLNYLIDPSLIASRVPVGTSIDTWNGQTYLSVVGFLMQNTKVLGVAIPFHRNFEEVNLRFYVRRAHPEGDRRAVAFVKEIVPRRAIALVAKLVYNEQYVAVPMRHRIDREGDTLRPNSVVAYGWRTGRTWNVLRARIVGEPMELAAGSEEEFIVEHYWGYAARRDGGTTEYQIEHPPWRVWQVKRARLDCDVESVYGPEFAEVLEGPPTSAFVADGSAIIVRRGVRIA